MSKSVFLSLLQRAWRPTVKTTLWLLKIMLPVSLAMVLLQYSGFIGWLSGHLDVVFRFLGLPTASAFAFVTGAFVGTYGGLAAMLALPLTLREATIVTLMILICHSLPMECAVMRKTGSSFMRMAVLRVVAAFVVAACLNLLLPESDAPFSTGVAQQDAQPLSVILLDWCWSSLKMSAMVLAIIYGLMVVQRAMEQYGVIDYLVKPLAPLMAIFGLPRGAAYLWLTANVLGVSYGSAVMMDLQEQGAFTPAEGNEVNYHLAMNHSMIEDTLLFAAYGISAWWIIGTRVGFALISVWTRRAYRAVFKHAQ